MIKLNLECSIDNIGYLVHMEHDEVNAELEELLEEELPWTHYDHVKNEKKSGNIPPYVGWGELLPVLRVKR